MSDTDKNLPAPAASTTPFSPDILEFQPDAVELEERPVPMAARLTLYTILLFIILAVLWGRIYRSRTYRCRTGQGGDHDTTNYRAAIDHGDNQKAST